MRYRNKYKAFKGDNEQWGVDLTKEYDEFQNSLLYEPEFSHEQALEMAAYMNENPDATFDEMFYQLDCFAEERRAKAEREAK